MFYGNHRRYLNEPEVGSLEPPDEFKTKRQHNLARASREAASRNEDRFNFQMNFQKKQEEDSSEPANNGKKFRRVANLVRHTVVTVDHFSSIQHDDWVEEYEAGIRLWVNKETGEVSSHCPWESEMDSTKSFIQKNDDEFAGTGSLVYDRSEISELFDILDRETGKKK